MLKAITIAFILGVSTHHGLFIHGEWHLQAPNILGAYLLIIISLLFATEQYSYTYSQQLSLIQITIPLMVYSLSLLASISIYRIYFHRLRGFPGPSLASLSKLWHVWKCRDSRNHLVLESWHRKYGTFVRTGPSEITIFHPAAYEIMDGPKNRNTRSDWYDLIYPRASTIFTRDKIVHNARRKMWDNALSSSSLAEYLKRIPDQVQTLTDIIDENGQKPMLVNELMYWFAFDSMGDFGFGKEFGMMRNRKWVDGAFYMRSAITLLGPFSPAIWIPRITFAFFPRVSKLRHWFKMLSFGDSCMSSRMKVRFSSRGSESLDIAGWFIKDYRSRDADKISDQLLSGDTATMIVAGSTTTAPSLIILLYFLARHPEHVAKIQQELERIDISDIRCLSNLQHLTATIHESMRLLPAALTSSSRVTPTEGLTFEGTFIPGNTKITAPRYSMGRLASAYEAPHDFIPERWYSRPEFVKDKRAFAPFGIGRNNCVGKNLAMHQLRIVVAALLSKYHIKFAPGERNGEAVERDMKDQLTATPGNLVLIFEKRDG
ncbi:benzoate 4-monooxygenase cytochrome P450 [Hypoxylon sp. FL0890]|nr:benzoate 4-monooxygenase cytochrome P450 [Hypoxylon sp. FL0890]